MFNLPNSLTFARIASIPLIVVLLYFPGKLTSALAMLVFIAASLTDLVDGMVARKYNMVTNMGKFLDPLADKLLITSVMIMLVANGWLQAWIAIVIIGREITVTGLRAIAADQNIVIAADSYGKLKTIFQVVALCPLILHYPWWGFDPNLMGQILIHIALVLAVFSGVNYLRRFYSQAREN
ncbi:CDP-diacylglycerol--glycerol-3-phosphate 3-phosphatidyltransferase [Desulfonatronovibrio hydrogenovorans]|uniref:CDP-diacylglycerol--glycerol-3-phosphate 3-phosphatidyltransferase n=1 Tax=Desulfonatronovibrio hydrogenovorans TaxID=53245 RepID=UPI00048CB654|nr:CDP-diacylglycerol--glycerol-3-phosphate 3-phosphatidyltransferase [Desulfonatronovibrio hydrogenovorans]